MAREVDLKSYPCKVSLGFLRSPRFSPESLGIICGPRASGGKALALQGPRRKGGEGRGEFEATLAWVASHSVQQAWNAGPAAKQQQVEDAVGNFGFPAWVIPLYSTAQHSRA